MYEDELSNEDLPIAISLAENLSRRLILRAWCHWRKFATKAKSLKRKLEYIRLRNTARLLSRAFVAWTYFVEDQEHSSQDVGSHGNGSFMCLTYYFDLWVYNAHARNVMRKQNTFDNRKLIAKYFDFWSTNIQQQQQSDRIKSEIDPNVRFLEKRMNQKYKFLEIRMKKIEAACKIQTWWRRRVSCHDCRCIARTWRDIFTVSQLQRDQYQLECAQKIQGLEQQIQQTEASRTLFQPICKRIQDTGFLEDITKITNSMAEIFAHLNKLYPNNMDLEKLKCGMLSKKGQKNKKRWKDRLFVLEDKTTHDNVELTLSYYKLGDIKARGIIPLRTILSIETSNAEENTFLIKRIGMNRNFLLSAPDSKTMSDWVKVLNFKCLLVTLDTPGIEQQLMDAHINSLDDLEYPKGKVLLDLPDLADTITLSAQYPFGYSTPLE